MQIEDFAFGSIRIDGITHEHDVVIEDGEIRKRKKKASKKFREEFGHTPLSGDRHAGSGRTRRRRQAIYAFLSLIAIGRALTGGRRREARIDLISRSNS